MSSKTMLETAADMKTLNMSCSKRRIMVTRDVLIFSLRRLGTYYLLGVAAIYTYSIAFWLQRKWFFERVNLLTSISIFFSVPFYIDRINGLLVFKFTLAEL